jgi:hypothetical protein
VKPVLGAVWTPKPTDFTEPLEKVTWMEAGKLFSHEDHVSLSPIHTKQPHFLMVPNVENMLQLDCLSSPLEEKMSKPK